MSTTQHPRWQVFTDEPIARYMATQAAEAPNPVLPVHVLDPGSGPGTLLEAFLEEFTKGTDCPIGAVAVEKDPILAVDTSTLDLPPQVALKVYNEDFFEYYGRSAKKFFSHIIMNPPYGRPKRDSEEQRTLRSLKLPTHNFYAAFLLAAFNLLQDDGVLVAIVPRSILTGTLAQALRRQILGSGHLELVTTFASRKLAFTRDEVQQDVVILALRKQSQAAESDVPSDLRIGKVLSVAPWRCTELLFPYDSVVRGSDDAPYIVVPTGNSDMAGHLPVLIGGLGVTTGPVVDFRLREFISSQRSDGAVPLIDATRRRGTDRFLQLDPIVRKHVHEPGVYLTMNRFSPPEQRPRVKARLIDARRECGVAFENHVNVIHRDGGPLEYEEAGRLLAILNHPSIDRQLAELSSSTHINAVDIQRLRRPLDADTR